MQRSSALARLGRPRPHAAALGRRQNWLQLARFCAVGASGYVVNLAVYTLLLHGAGSTISLPRPAPSSSP